MNPTMTNLLTQEKFMMNDTPETVSLVPIDSIEVLNSRERNMKVFEEIVGNIRAIGLKKPITVSPRFSDGEPEKYILVCGEGRLNAFRILGETHIPAMVVNVSDEDAKMLRDIVLALTTEYQKNMEL